MSSSGSSSCSSSASRDCNGRGSCILSPRANSGRLGPGGYTNDRVAAENLIVPSPLLLSSMSKSFTPDGPRSNFARAQTRYVAASISRIESDIGSSNYR